LETSATCVADRRQNEDVESYSRRKRDLPTIGKTRKRREVKFNEDACLRRKKGVLPIVGKRLGANKGTNIAVKKVRTDTVPQNSRNIQPYFRT
jgi:hypothetical protein